MKPATLHKRACRLLGVDPARVPLVGPTEWRKIVGVGVGNFRGKAFTRTRHLEDAVAVRIVYVNRNALYDTYVHEVLHILWPSRPHWWVYAAAYRLAGLPDRAISALVLGGGGRTLEPVARLRYAARARAA